jgi:4'-phosphopantetheinyl transferase
VTNVALKSKLSPVPFAALGSVHVSYMFTDARREPAVRRAYYALLCDEERSRYARFVFDRDRDAYLMAHVLLRATLSRYAHVSPEQWRFRTLDRGRPEVAEPNTVPRLRFNLSHTAQLVACVVAAERDVGIDVEYVRDGPLVERVADRCFSRLELEALSLAPRRKRAEVFFDYWTLKESYVKARGLGLAVPLDEFSFHLSHGSPPTISFATVQDDAASWQFALHRPRPNCRLAVAMRREPGANIQFEFTRVVPAEDPSWDLVELGESTGPGCGDCAKLE